MVKNDYIKLPRNITGLGGKYLTVHDISLGVLLLLLTPSSAV